MLPHIHRALHAVNGRNPHYGIHFRVLTKILRLSGGGHLHTGSVVGKLEGNRASTLGWIDLLREKYITGGIHVWHMPALVTIFGGGTVLQFGGGTLGHPWGNAAGAAGAFCWRRTTRRVRRAAPQPAAHGG